MDENRSDAIRGRKDGYTLVGYLVDLYEELLNSLYEEELRRTT